MVVSSFRNLRAVFCASKGLNLPFSFAVDIFPASFRFAPFWGFQRPAPWGFQLSAELLPFLVSSFRSPGPFLGAYISGYDLVPLYSKTPFFDCRNHYARKAGFEFRFSGASEILPPAAPFCRIYSAKFARASIRALLARSTTHTGAAPAGFQIPARLFEKSARLCARATPPVMPHRQAYPHHGAGYPLFRKLPFTRERGTPPV